MDDLAGLETHLGRAADAVLGHSFGGKVALLHAGRAAPGPRQYWIVDSAPGGAVPQGARGACWGCSGTGRPVREPGRGGGRHGVLRNADHMTI